MLQLYLEGLSCSSCAGKIEDAVSKLPQVKGASISFAASTFNIELESGEDETLVLEKVEKIIKRIEPQVIVSRKDSNKMYSEDGISCVSCGTDNAPVKSVEKKKSILRYFLTNYRLLAGIMIYLTAALMGYYQENYLVLYLAAYFLIGYDVIKSAIRNIMNKELFDENFLMFIATVGAFSIGEFSEGVAVMLFYEIGEVFQSYAVDSSRKSIKDLIDIKAEYANRYEGGALTKVTPETLIVGDIILIKPGEKVPVDGEIVEGSSMMDTSPLTGESIPRSAREGDKVLSGFINTTSSLKMKVEKVYEDSAVAKILYLIENASSKKSNTEKLITKFARYYTPIVVLFAVLISVVPPLVTGDPFSQWLQRGLIFLVVSCPCALVISIPLGYFGGVGAASGQGILIKGTQYLEALKNMDTIVFDKTGTLTKGVFEVTEIITAKDETVESIVEAAAAAEAYSNHPIARSITKFYKKNIDLDTVKDYIENPGRGVKASYQGQSIIAGNQQLMMENGIAIINPKEAGTIVHVARDKKYLGYMLITDEIKSNTLSLVDDLKKEGIKKTVMFTGDHKNIAEYIKGILEIDEVKAELLPQDKVFEFERLKSLQSSKKTIGFVGDGINDAPVLAMADVGISMGSLGSDAAIEASDIVLMKDDPSKIVLGIRIAKYTHKIIIQNIFFALGVKILVMILGTLGYANMWSAVFADVGVALIAVLNVSRIFYAGKKMDKPAAA